MHLFSLTLGNGLVIEEQPPGSRWAGLGQVILSLTSITCKVGVAMPPHSGGSACQMRRPVKSIWHAVGLSKFKGERTSINCNFSWVPSAPGLPPPRGREGNLTPGVFLLHPQQPLSCLAFR